MYRLLALVVVLVVCAASARHHDGGLTIEREKLLHFYKQYATEYSDTTTTTKSNVS